ncbi:MAG TPA: MMPL family transporter [Polyangia bacterium]|nr:MMPL family transporter [Polyangia bacterium]
MKRLWCRLALLQVRRPFAFLLIFAVLASGGAWRASKLKLVTDFSGLLAERQPSVLELHRILDRIRGMSNVFVVLEGTDPNTLRHAADVLEPPLRAIGSPWVARARSGVQDARRFLMPRAGLYLSKAELDDLEERLTEQEQAAFRRRIGADLDDSEDAGRAPLRADEIEKRLRDKLKGAADYPDGYFLDRTPTGWAQIVALKAAVAAGDLRLGRETLDRVQAVVGKTLAEQGLAGRVKVGYAGDLVTGMAEYDMVRHDIADVGGFGIALVLLVLVIFFRTPVPLLALGGTIAVGCALTFGLTELTLRHLNIATAFLFSIVAGNGINFGIIWMSRYLEERRRGRAVPGAIVRALDRTYGATLTAAGAAGTAYAALGISNFRGFRHFAIIGALGMALCWLVTYTLMPALVVLLERVQRRWDGSPEARRVLGGSGVFTRLEWPAAWLVRRAPSATLIASLALSAAAAVVGARYLLRGALEYDMHHLRSDPDTTSDLYRVSHIASQILNAGGSAGMIVLTENPRDTPVVAQLLRQKRDSVPWADRPFEDVHTVDDLVPPDQPAQLRRLGTLARRLGRARERGAIDDAVWMRMQLLLPTPDVVPFGVADLPFELREPYTEKDGRIGRILYVEATVGQSDSNLHYLLRWADAFRSTQLPDGRIVHGSGSPVIFADLLRSSLVDMPRSVLLSLGLTALSVALFFRRLRGTALVLASLAVALTWMIGAMAVARVRLSFINFIALPITFGIGVDYPVNICGRYLQNTRKGILSALEGAGGPVTLCSLTTSLGYLALLRAHNQAVRSLGAVAVLGEVTCLLSALLFLPAAVTWLERRRSARLGVPRPAAAEPLR